MAGETLLSNKTGAYVCYRIHGPALVRSVETRHRWQKRYFPNVKRGQPIQGWRVLELVYR